MSKTSDSISTLYSDEIIFETKSGSLKISADKEGRFKIGAYDAPGTADTLVIDPINNKIQTSEIIFSDGTSLDSSAGLKNANFLDIKANKLFFKYDSDGVPIPNQTIEIKVKKDPTITSPVTFSFSPSLQNNINLIQVNSTTWNLTITEFEKLNSDTVLVTATAGDYSDSITIFKTSDGTDAMVGGLTNPTVTIPVESNGTIDAGQLSTYLAAAGGKFVVFKAGEELTGDPGKVLYSVSSSTQGLSLSIQNNGIYTVSNFDVTRELGQAILSVKDLATGQQFKTAYSIITARKGATGATGATGASGNNAKVVKLSIDDAQIAYSASDSSPSPRQIQITASQQNHAGTVFYEFIVYEGGSQTGTTLVNSTSNNILLTDSNKNYGSTSYLFINPTKTQYSKSKTVKVITREGSSTANAIAQDSITIIATKDGSDSLEIVFPNNNHSFPANADGTIDVASYVGGGSIVEAYIGNEQLTPTLSTLTNGMFKVAINSVNNIVAGAISPDQPTKRMILADPSAMSASANTADITYLISGQDSKGLSKSQLIKASFTKSKKGDAGADALSGLLTNESHTIAASSSGEIFNFNVSSFNAAGGTFNVYKGGQLINSSVAYTIPGGTSTATSSSIVQNGLTASLNKTTGLYTLSVLNSSSWSSLSETFTFRATSGSTNLDKSYTIVKSLGGANAKILILYSNKQVFKKDTNGTYYPNQIVQFTSSLNNITTPIVWTVDGLSTGVSANGGVGTKLNVSLNGLSASMSASQFDLARGSNTFTTIKAATTDSGIAYDDTITLELIQDGAQGAQGPQGNPGAEGQQGPDGPEGGNPEDIGCFSSIYVKNNIKYPWGWGRISSVSNTIQTVLNDPATSPVEEKLIYDPDLADAVQSNSLAIKGGYVFYPQQSLAVSTNTFSYCRPLYINRNATGKLRFGITRENSNTGMGTITLGLYYLNENLQKLTASNGQALYNFKTFTSTTLISTSTRTTNFYFYYDSKTAAQFSTSAQTPQTSNSAGSNYSVDNTTNNWSSISNCPIPSDARYVVPFIHIAGATNCKIIVNEAAWFNQGEIIQTNATQLYVGRKDIVEKTLTDNVTIEDSLRINDPVYAPIFVVTNRGDSGIYFGDYPSGGSNLKTYEYGTWTPTLRALSTVLQADSTPENTSFTAIYDTTNNLDYNRNNGTYTRIGNVVHIRGQLRITSFTNKPLGQLFIGGIPFVADHWNGGIGGIEIVDWDFGGGTAIRVMFGEIEYKNIWLTEQAIALRTLASSNSTVGGDDLVGSAIGTSLRLRFYGTYKVS